VRLAVREGHTEKLAVHVACPPRPSVDTLSVAVRVRERVDVVEGVAGTEAEALAETQAVGVNHDAVAVPETEWEGEGDRESRAEGDADADKEGERVEDVDAE
jgi:hypothetical protein